jgi:hypothetical protein
MQQEQLIEYITEGIIHCLDRKDIQVPSEAADDVVQLALLREYIALDQHLASVDEAQSSIPSPTDAMGAI